MARALLALALLVTGCESHPKVDWANLTPPPHSPAAPAGIGLEPDHERVTVSWVPNSAEDQTSSYTVYSAAEDWQTWTASLPAAVRTTGVSCCSFVRSDLLNEQEHWFAVSANNEFGEGSAAPPLKVVPPGWVGSRQAGTATSDFSSSVTVGASGDLYAAGDTLGALHGETPFGLVDGYVAHYRTSGQRVWTRLIGTLADDQVLAVAVDITGDVVVAGFTNGAFPGETAQGMGDAFVAKFSEDGDLEWLHQFGTASPDSASAVAVFGTNAICLVGTTSADLDGETNQGSQDAFVTLYDGTGTRQWTRLIGTSAAEVGKAVAFSPSGKIYVAGTTTGALQGSNLGGVDAFVSERFTNGGQSWIRQFGSSLNERVEGVATDEQRDRVYVSGDTPGAFGGQTVSGPSDPFVVAYDRGPGTIAWTRFIGGSSAENPATLSTLPDGRIIAAYYAAQAVTLQDVIVSQLGTNGSVAWTTSVGSGSLDYLGGLSTDGYGNAYITGQTMGSIGAANAGDWDYFVSKLGPDGIVR